MLTPVIIAAACLCFLSQGVPLVCTSTGVKHLHHRAAMFDIGVYFEANGHGTVLFSAGAQERLSVATKDTESVT